MSMTCEVTFPDEVVQSLRLSKSTLEHSIKKELAVHLFQMQLLSFGQARQLANLSVWDFLDFLSERKLPLHYDIPEYEEDLKTIEELLP